LSHILVVTTLPDRESARGIAQALVDARLAACVTIGAPVTSMYHWHGATETAEEVPLSIKTRADLFDRVASAIRSRHPYELPEIVAVPLSDAIPDYLAWIDAETAPR
jgi:periplasmic divalent cation tolerance protein